MTVTEITTGKFGNGNTDSNAFLTIFIISVLAYFRNSLEPERGRSDMTEDNDSNSFEDPCTVSSVSNSS
jgi:hypothetical protein